MPSWTLDPNVGSLVKPGATPPPPKIPDLKPAGPVYDKYADNGMADRIKRAAQKQEGETDNTRIAVDMVGVGTGLREIGELTIADHLDQARSLIREEKYEEALALLGEFLRKSPGHAEATFLTGYCQCALDQPETALRTVAPLIRAPHPGLESRLRQLRVSIREKMSAGVIDAVADREPRGATRGALARLDELLDLDPGVGIYHCFRVHLLIVANRLSEALVGARRAAEDCHGNDKGLLDSMEGEILVRQCEAAVEPARQHYRERQWRKARKAMEQIRPQLGAMPIWGVFYNYLEALGGGLLSRGRMPSEVVPAGPFALVDKLHFLLVREELNLAKRLLDEADDRAQQVLNRGLELAPHFPYLHYLQAQAIYIWLIHDIMEGEGLDLDRHESLVKEARHHADIGATDKEIDGAEELRTLLAGLALALADARAEMEKEQREVEAHFAPLDGEFRSIIEDAREGIRSTEHFRDLQKRMRALRGKIAPARKKASLKRVLELFDAFKATVERNWAQLEKIEPEVVIAEQLSHYRQRIRDLIDKASKQGTPAAVLRQSISTIQQEVKAYAKKSELPAEARKAAQTLAEEIEQIFVSP